MIGISALAGFVVLCTGHPIAGQPAGRMARPAGTYGYVLRTIYYPVNADATSCPTQSLGSLEIFEQGLSAEERAEYGGPANRTKLIGLMAQRLGLKSGKSSVTTRAEYADPAALDRLREQLGIAPGKGALVSLGARFAYDTCTNPEDFPQFDLGNQLFLGKVSIGANLDGRTGKDDFTSPDGAKGIDNNLLRATGCNLGARDSGDSSLADKSLRSETAPTLLELSGVDSFENDDAVVLRIFAAAQSVEVGANGDALPFASMDVDPDPRYMATVKGRIVNGVLETDPFAFAMRQKISVIDSYMGMVGARLSIRFGPDGSISGEAHGYQTLDSLDYTYHHYSQNAADFSATSCPAMMSAIHRLADGFRDRKTGRFTAISAAYKFNGVPAFLIAPSGAGKAGSRGEGPGT